MRLLVFFDLPVTSKQERKEATTFRQFLLKEGFYMVQFSLYGRICNTFENAKMHEQKVSAHAPCAGSIRSLIVTEKQYATMNILSGKPKPKEKSIKSHQISFF